MQPLFGGKGTLTASLTFTALSGGRFRCWASTRFTARETFILPSGSGGRTPMITQMDAHIGYDHQLTDQVKATLYVDVINLFNQQEVINVDDEYTFSFVDPIRYGKPEDLEEAALARWLGAGAQQQLRPAHRLPGSALSARRRPPRLLTSPLCNENP